MSLLLLALAACDREPPTCVYTGCDELCVEEGAAWECTDTAAAWEACYDQGFQVCEAQPDHTCGWTMVDAAGWDACVDGATFRQPSTVSHPRSFRSVTRRVGRPMPSRQSGSAQAA